MPIFFATNMKTHSYINSKGDNIQLSKVTKQGVGFRLLEELGTEPRVYDLPSANRKYAPPGKLIDKEAGEKKSWP